MDNLIVSIRKWWEKSSKQQRTLAVLFSVGILATGMLLMVSGEPGVQGDSIGSSLYYMGVMVKLVGVLLLIVGGAVLLRRFQLRSSGLFGRQLKLIETVRLAPKQALHLVQIGERKLLIGATDNAISLLAEMPDQPAPAEAVQPVVAEVAEKKSFGEVMQSYTQTGSEGEVGGSV
jgi:flagellar biosynthetic protein FliO